MIDEWPEVPSLWDAVRGKVDSLPTKGQFILTGSATINKNRYIYSGTGRIARLKMRPMTLYESKASDGKISLEDICKGKAPDCLTGEIDLKHLIDLVLIGGWPAIGDMTVEQAMLIAKEYVKSIIQEDIYKVDDIRRDEHKIELLLKSLARNEATTVTNTTLKKDIKEKLMNDLEMFGFLFESLVERDLYTYLNASTPIYITIRTIRTTRWMPSSN